MRIARFMVLFILLLLPVLCVAQGQTSGSITTAGADCSVATNCVSLNINSSAGAGVITLGNTFNATAQFEGTSGGATPVWVAVNATPLNSSTPVTSATTSGTWRINVAGLAAVRVRCSAYTSGTIDVRITYGSGSASTGSGSVTNPSALTLNHVMIGGGANVAAVDSACVTDGAGAMSGCNSYSSGTVAGVTNAATAILAATGGDCSTGLTPTAGVLWIDMCSSGIFKFAFGDAGTPGPLNVASGGWGVGTLTAHALYVGNTTSAPAAVAVPAADSLLYGTTAADPSFKALPTSGTNGCSGSTDMLQFNTSTHAFACGTSAAGGSPMILWWPQTGTVADNSTKYVIPVGTPSATPQNGYFTVSHNCTAQNGKLITGGSAQPATSLTLTINSVTASTNTVGAAVGSWTIVVTTGTAAGTTVSGSGTASLTAGSLYLLKAVEGSTGSPSAPLSAIATDCQ
jgi:hypothetical protein